MQTAQCCLCLNHFQTECDTEIRLCEHCKTGLIQRANMRKLSPSSQLPDQIPLNSTHTPPATSQNVVNCLHCGHLFDSKDSLWSHMVVSRQRLISQSEMDKCSEWLEVVAGLLETQYTGPTSLQVELYRRKNAVFEVSHVEMREEEWYLPLYRSNSTDLVD